MSRERILYQFHRLRELRGGTGTIVLADSLLSFAYLRLHNIEDRVGIERLFLVSHGRRLAIGGFLSPAEKASFARALSSALGEAKRGPTRTTSV